MTYDITINISNVKTNDAFELEKLCIMMTQLCTTVCEVSDFTVVNTFDLPKYELKEVKQ